ncbi:MAG: hypothetical protein A3F72_21675 [Bacteroidetes bacterium RIFCSPLOWO2_12_FULL_35_15]|nr:MAG: hypothetical protein A3F72_21675 [Bacteroidetes bacterium RIFCSPLOWO2_12_FULL_35_15]
MKKSFIIIFVSILSSVLQAQTPTYEWAKQFGGTLNDYAYSTAVDTAGNVYTTGFFQGTVDFDPGANTINLTSAGASDIFISKVDAAGNFVWAKKIGGTASDYGFALTLDKYSNVYVSGYFKGLADFDPGANTVNLTPTGSFDVFITKFDAAGNFAWAKKFDGASDESCTSIKVDELGNIYTVGSFNSATDFDPGANTVTLTPLGSTDIFISKLDAAGNFVWVKQMGGAGLDAGKSITTDATGNVYVSGYFLGTSDFDPSSNTVNLISAGAEDIFVSKLDASGNFLWAKQFGGLSADYGLSLTVDASGNVFSTGFFNGTADFDPSANTSNLTSAGLDDFFISKLDAAGNLVWVKQIGSTSYDEAKCITMDASFNLYITGSFNGTVDFDPGININNLTSAGGDDVFICKLDASGNFVWAKQLGGTSNDYATSIKVDASNRVYTSGYFQGTGDFDPGINTVNLISAGGPDAFIHKVNQSISTTLSETNLSSGVQLFPNPTNGQINFIFDHQLTNVNLKLINSMGQLVFERSDLSGTNFSIDVAEQANGIYLLEIIYSGTVYRTKFIKN